jgi:hypothetical protein
MCYFQLLNEDYRWWWRSFLHSGSCAFYTALYAVWYHLVELDMNGIVPVLLYYGYMFIICFTFFLITGRCHMSYAHMSYANMSYAIVIELDKMHVIVFLSIFPIYIDKDQIWTFNLVYIYADWSFCYTHLTYNVFSFYAIMVYGIWFILYLVSMTYTHMTYTHMTYTSQAPSGTSPASGSTCTSTAPSRSTRHTVRTVHIVHTVRTVVD